MKNYKIIRLPEVMDRTGLGRSTVYLMISNKLFPKPIPLSARSVGWIEKDIDNWIEQKILKAKKDGGF